MPLTVMRSVKSELLTPRKGQTACWEYPLRMFLTSKISVLLLPPSVQDTVPHFHEKKASHGTILMKIELQHKTNRTHAKSTNSGNAKMLIPTFTRGSEVGLFKQREVCKVKKWITHSHCASEVLTSVNTQYHSTRSRKCWACLCQ